ncbi:MAG TPA: YncE family protein, partial [Armatimonadaceae bacterium]|nr:YncE family protein [Armatimonadaceae bacterium]
MRRNAAWFAACAALFTAGAGYIATVSPPVGPQRGGIAHRVATSQTVRPVGDVLTLPGSRPVDIALTPDGKTLYVKDNRGVVAVDADSWREKGFLKFPAGGGSMHGLAVSRDGRRIYATNSASLLGVATAIGSDGRLAWSRQITLPGPKSGGASYPCGLALSADEKTAYVCLSRSNALAVVDLDSGAVAAEIPVGVAPYAVVLSADGATAYVSDWGGRRPKQGEPSAPSAGTPALVDKRGVAASGAVSFVDIASRRRGRGPCRTGAVRPPPARPPGATRCPRRTPRRSRPRRACRPGRAYPRRGPRVHPVSGGVRPSPRR